MPSPLIQWFPGHMAKTRRMIAENLKYVDIVIELRDARIPQSSANPELHSIVGEKPVLHIFSKSKLADPKASIQWKKELEKNGDRCLFIDSLTSEGIGQIKPEIDHILVDKLARYRDKGTHGRTLKAMVVGIPNVGKSTFINSLAGKACAKTGNKPGVTKGKQWIRLNKNVELLDTPGILWPKFEDQAVGLKLAFIGSIKDEILQTEELASELVDFINRSYPGVLEEKYAIEHSDDKFEVLEKIAQSRHCLVRGNEFDTEKAAAILLDDFRNGRLGRITLEVPEAV